MIISIGDLRVCGIKRLLRVNKHLIDGSDLGVQIRDAGLHFTRDGAAQLLLHIALNAGLHGFQILASAGFTALKILLQLFQAVGQDLIVLEIVYVFTGQDIIHEVGLLLIPPTHDIRFDRRSESIRVESDLFQRRFFADLSKAVRRQLIIQLRLDGFCDFKICNLFGDCARDIHLFDLPIHCGGELILNVRYDSGNELVIRILQFLRNRQCDIDIHAILHLVEVINKRAKDITAAGIDHIAISLDLIDVGHDFLFHSKHGFISRLIVVSLAIARQIQCIGVLERAVCILVSILIGAQNVERYCELRINSALISGLLEHILRHRVGQLQQFFHTCLSRGNSNVIFQNLYDLVGQSLHFFLRRSRIESIQLRLQLRIKGVHIVKGNGDRIAGFRGVSYSKGIGNSFELLHLRIQNILPDILCQTDHGCKKLLCTVTACILQYGIRHTGRRQKHDLAAHRNADMGVIVIGVRCGGNPVLSKGNILPIDTFHIIDKLFIHGSFCVTGQLGRKVRGTRHQTIQIGAARHSLHIRIECRRLAGDSRHAIVHCLTKPIDRPLRIQGRTRICGEAGLISIVGTTAIRFRVPAQESIILVGLQRACGQVLGDVLRERLNLHRTAAAVVRVKRYHNRLNGSEIRRHRYIAGHRSRSNRPAGKFITLVCRCGDLCSIYGKLIAINREGRSIGNICNARLADRTIGSFIHGDGHGICKGIRGVQLHSLRDGTPVAVQQENLDVFIATRYGQREGCIARTCGFDITYAHLFTLIQCSHHIIDSRLSISDRDGIGFLTLDHHDAVHSLAVDAAVFLQDYVVGIDRDRKGLVNDAIAGPVELVSPCQNRAVCQCVLQIFRLYRQPAAHVVPATGHTVIACAEVSAKSVRPVIRERHLAHIALGHSGGSDDLHTDPPAVLISADTGICWIPIQGSPRDGDIIPVHSTHCGDRLNGAQGIRFGCKSLAWHHCPYHDDRQ